MSKTIKTAAPKKVIFEYKKLSADVLAKREKENLSFRAVFASHKIPVHILHSIESGVQVPSCENFALVLNWLGKTANDYFTTK